MEFGVEGCWGPVATADLTRGGKVEKPDGGGGLRGRRGAARGRGCHRRSEGNRWAGFRAGELDTVGLARGWVAEADWSQQHR